MIEVVMKAIEEINTVLIETVVPIEMNIKRTITMVEIYIEIIMDLLIIDMIMDLLIKDIRTSLNRTRILIDFNNL